MTKEFGRGFAKANIKNIRKFYLTYKDRIGQLSISQLESVKSQSLISQLESIKVQNLFMLSWTHYLQLMRIENPDERSFYEIEAIRGAWSVRTLQRQYNSSLYERIALSKDANIYASEYKLYLPDKEVLQRKLQEWLDE